MKRSLNLALFFSLALSFCTPVSFAVPQNISLLKTDIHHYHDSGQYDQDLTREIKLAEAFLQEKIEYYKTHKTDKKLALVLDIDETSLSNYDKIVQRDFAANLPQIHKEIKEGNAPAIKPTLALYDMALRNGVEVFFVTGRFKSELSATIKNLNQAGYKNWSGIYVRPEVYKEPSIIAFKAESRKKIEDKGYIVLATIGDQYSDIKGGHAQKGFKLPNPFYYIP